MSPKKKFPEKIKTKVLQLCDRHCCWCGKACDTNIEIHHLDPERNDMDNAVPLCFDCHHKIAQYNKDHPTGNKYRIEEIKAKRERIYEKYTRELVPQIDFSITQEILGTATFKREFPDVGFTIKNCSMDIPLTALVFVRIILGNEDQGLLEHDLYSGKSYWTLAPLEIIHGHFKIPGKYLKIKSDLKVEVRVGIIDQYNRKHWMVPRCWNYRADLNKWVPNPQITGKWH